MRDCDLPLKILRRLKLLDKSNKRSTLLPIFSKSSILQEYWDNSANRTEIISIPLWLISPSSLFSSFHVYTDRVKWVEVWVRKDSPPTLKLAVARLRSRRRLACFSAEKHMLRRSTLSRNEVSPSGPALAFRRHFFRRAYDPFEIIIT